MQACVVHSTDIDSEDAATEIISGVQRDLGTSAPRAALLFAGIDHDFATVLRRINEAWPGIELIGCTTDGELSSKQGFAEDSLAMVVLTGEDFHVASGVARSVGGDPSNVIRESIVTAKNRLGSAASFCIATPVSLTVSETAVLGALRDALGNSVPVFGGTAGDQWRFKGSWQFYGSEVLQDSVPFLLFGGGIAFSFGVETGWYPMGREGRVTNTEGNILRAINGKPATDFYRELLGNVDITHLGEYPLAVFEGKETSYYLRASSHTDEASGVLHFVGDIPEGSRVRISSTTRDQIIEATNNALRRAVAEFPGKKPALVLCFSCAGRKQVLGSRTSEESQVVRNLLGAVPAVGFYGYGEIAPIEKNGISQFHNETFVALILGES
jgi:hypothetical protein